MAIRMMDNSTGAWNKEACKSHSWSELPFVVSYEGCVLAKREANFYDDSDFIAIVWDEDEQRIKDVEYATTRGWTYPNSASVDATEEVIAKATEWMRERILEARIANDDHQSHIPEKGRRVHVTKGKHKGNAGEVFWYGEGRNFGDPYGYKYGRTGPMRVGFKSDVDGEKIFTNADNVEVLEPEQYRTPTAELREAIWGDRFDFTYWSYACIPGHLAERMR